MRRQLSPFLLRIPDIKEIIMNTLKIGSGDGFIEIDAQPGTLYVVYEIGAGTPTSVLYANNGGAPSTPLPEGESTYQVPVNSFHISYEMGESTSIKLSWWYQ